MKKYLLLLLLPTASHAQFDVQRWMQCVNERSCYSNPTTRNDCMIECRNEQRRENYERKRAEREAKEAAIRASQRPPDKIWRIGDRLYWTNPSSGPRPNGYRVENGDTISHPYHPYSSSKQVYEHRLHYHRASGKVEAEYGSGLNHRVYSESLDTPPEAQLTVQVVRFYATSHPRLKGRNRWRRVLAGFGVPCGVGHAGRGEVCGLEPAMKASEAQVYADRRWSPWWTHVANVLRRLEASE